MEKGWVFTWGSASHGALGYVVAHSVRTVEVPRRVSVTGGSVALAVGKSYTSVLTADGEVFRWGHKLGLLPSPVATTVRAGKLVGYSFFIEAGTGKLYEIEQASVEPVILNGKFVYVSDAAVVGTSHLMLVDGDSGRLIETGKKPTLSPAGLLQLGPVARIFSSPSGFFAAENLDTGELRVWTRQCAPRKVLVRQSRGAAVGLEWESATNQFFLKSVESLALPVSGDTAYAVSREELVVMMGLSIDQSVIHAHVWPLTREGAVARFKAVAQTATAVYAVTLQGDCYALPPFGDQLSPVQELGPPVLSQVISLVASAHHVAATVQIVPLPFSHEILSLQTICARTVMQSHVTVENVADLLLVLVRRAVVDSSALLNMAYKYFSLNRGLVVAVAERAVEAMRAVPGVTAAESEYARGGCDFSDCLVKARLAEPEIAPAAQKTTASSLVVRISSPRVSPRVKSKRAVPSLASTQPSSAIATPPMTPVITMRIESDQPFESPFCLDDFVPLTDATVLRNAASPPIRAKRVSKWTKQRLDNSPAQPPWLSPENSIASSPSLADVMTQEPRARTNRAENSRWFVENESRTSSVAELMRQEQEEREAIEAVRLVEEYERALALHSATAKMSGKKYTRQNQRGKPH